MGQDAILGREEELAAIAHFIDGDRSRLRALLLEGEAGIGKSTLWEEAVRLAEGTGLVLTSRAAQVETKLSFTVLGDLLAPVLDETLGGLPAGQRAALEAALLIGPPPRSRPDARAVSLGVLGVLRSLASDGPVTIAIDDVQWTDPPSTRALTFTLRRLDDEPVAVVASKRVAPGLTDPLDLAALPSGVDRLTVGPIAPVSLGQLLRRRLGRHFAPPLVRRIHEGSGGNPFFAVEIGRALGGDDPNPSPGEPLPVPMDLQELLRQRLSVLSGGARRVLLIAAASAVPTPALVEEAGEERSGLDEAEEAGIVVLRGGVIAFTHPLLASAVYTDATSRARQEVHACLARIATDLEERARHLALSTEGRNEDVAAVLGEAAQQAEGRGAPLAAAELYRLAAALTPEGSTEALRRRQHGELGNLWAAGDTVGARGLNSRLLASLGPGPGRAHTLWVMASASWNDLPCVTSLLTRALDEVGDDRSTRASILADMAWAALWRGEPPSSISLADAAVRASAELDESAPLRSALSVRAMAGGALGEDTTDLLERALSLDGTLSYAETGSPRIVLGQLQMWAGSLDAARVTLEMELQRRLEHGYESGAWEVRADLAEVEYRAGRWELAARHAEEAHDIVAETGLSDVLGEILPVKGAIACAMGDTSGARVIGNEALSLCERLGDTWDEIQTRAALGFLELSLGDHAACHAWLGPLVRLTEDMGLREPGVVPFVPDEVEALVALGELEAAGRLTFRLEEQGRSLKRPFVLATVSRCQGLIAGASRHPGEAEEHLQRALDLHRSVPQPFELGRTLLVAGVIYRRMRQQRRSRELLGQAHDVFEELGAPLWAAKARSELDGIGGRPPASAALTPTEQQVALLVAEGRTNREVAETLLMSVYTVDAHLRRIYRKVQVRSRTELARRL